MRQQIRTRALLPSPAERRRLRTAAGLTIAAVAAASGVTPPAVSMWEKGTRQPTGAALEAYVRVLGVLREEAAA